MSDWQPAPMLNFQPGRASLRVGDAERDEAIRLLGEHFAAGRLDHQEYDDRGSRALAARTFGDLDSLFRDLPTDRAAGPVRVVRRERRRAPYLFPAILVLVGMSILLHSPWLIFVGLGALILFKRSRHRSG